MKTHVLIESLSGFNKALQSGASRSDRFYTSSPSVYENLIRAEIDVRWLENNLDSDDGNKIGQASLEIIRNLKSEIEALAQKIDAPEIYKFMAIEAQRFLATFIFKQYIFHLWEQNTRGDKRMVLGLPELTPVNGPHFTFDTFDTMYTFIASKENCENLEIIGVHKGNIKELYSANDTVTWQGRLLSLCDFSLSQIFFRILKFVFKGRKVQLGSGPLVRILKENELIREMVPPLLFKGAGLSFIDPLKTTKPEELSLGSINLETIGLTLHKHDIRVNIALTTEVFRKRFEFVTRYWRPFMDAAHKRVNQYLNESEKQVIVSNTIGGLSSASLTIAAQKKNIPVLIAEHGVSSGLSEFHKAILDLSEVSLCDKYLTCSQNAAKFHDTEVSLRGKSIVVGLAKQIRTTPLKSLQRLLVRSELKAKSSDRVVMYLSRAIQNNMRFLPHSPENNQVHEFEKSIITKILPHLRGIPVAKFYDNRRVLDPHPFVGKYRAKAPVVTIQEGDFRFLRSGADIIMMNSPMSTIGWAMGSGKPIVYIEQPGIKLLPHIKERFQESFFYFDANKDDWEKEIVSFLSQPDEDIYKLWKSKKKQRSEFMKECAFGPKKAGKNSADFIVSL